MTRLKLFVFALVALGVAGYQVVLFERSFGHSAADAAAAGASGAAAEIALRVEARRGELQSAMVAALASGVALPPSPPAPARPGARAPVPGPSLVTEERLAPARRAALDAVGDALKPQLAVLLADESGALLSVGDAAGAPLPAELDRAAIVGAGPAGLVLPALGRGQYLFSSVPLGSSGAVVAVGGPLLADPAAALAEALRGGRVAALALLQERDIVASAGASPSLGQVASVAPGAVKSLSLGPVDTLGPLAFPLLDSTMALEVGAHRAIAGTRYGVVAIASSRAAVLRLVELERSSFVALAGLLLFALAFVVIGGGAVHDELGPALVIPPPVPVPPVRDRARSTGARPAVQSRQPSLAPTSAGALDTDGAGSAAPGGGEPMIPLPPDLGVVPELSPDDFEFPSGPSARPATAAAVSKRGAPAPVEAADDEPQAAGLGAGDGTEDPFAGMADASAPAARVSPQGPLNDPGFQAEEPAPETRAYPAMRGPGSPSPQRSAAGARGSAMTLDASAPSETAADDGDEAGDASTVGAEPEESTRVAAVPMELMRQARASDPSIPRASLRAAGPQHGVAPPSASPTSVIAAPSAPAQPPAPQPAAAQRSSSGGAGASDEERHFQDVFREFLATRERCGEASDGLTFEKFKAKLLKNKEQMLAKYNSRSVKFQVYVKEGKAAIKASPTKD